MSNQVKIKIHNVMHDEEDYDVSEAEKYIESYISSYDVANVRIASGNRNSPVFVVVNANSMTMENAKRVARSAINAFSRKVRSIDVDSTISDRNVRIHSID